MTEAQFHDFHRAHTRPHQHFQGVYDQYIGYRYLEKSNGNKTVVVFIPPHIKDFPVNIAESLLNKEFYGTP